MSRVLIGSGISYLGNIPNEWNIFRIKNAFKCRKNIVNDNWSNTQLLSLTTSGVKEKDIDNPNGKLPDSFDGYQYVEENNIIMCLFDLDCSAVFSGISKYNGMISPAYKVLECKEIMNPDYAGYYFNYIGFDRKYMHYSKNIRYTLNYDEFSLLPMLIPPLEEQKRISQYLDKQCEKIDEIINDNNHEIELLGEYKKSVFNDVIKKYKTKKYRLKYLISSKLQYGANSSGMAYDENLPRYVRITDILNNSLKGNDKLSLSEESAKEFILKEGDILFARSGGTVGKSFIYRNKFGRCAFAGYLIRAQFNDINLSEYVFNYTNSNLYEEWKNSIFIQSTIQNIGADKYNIMPVPVPIYNNDLLIINKEINLISKKIDKVIEYRKQIIEKLEEYKRSLIYECVTGKREV